jgi:hypothetical protein
MINANPIAIAAINTSKSTRPRPSMMPKKRISLTINLRSLLI